MLFVFSQVRLTCMTLYIIRLEKSISLEAFYGIRKMILGILSFRILVYYKISTTIVLGRKDNYEF